MKVTDTEKLRIQQALLDGLAEYNKSFTNASIRVETIVEDTSNNIIQILEK